MFSLKRAVRNTYQYASYFGSSLAPSQLHYWLICPRRISARRLLPFVLPQSPQDRKTAKLRHLVSRQKIDYAHRAINLLKHIPTIRLIAITGSVSISQAKPQDDIDLLIITTDHTLWLTRPLVILLLSLFFRRRHPSLRQQANAYCPNLWLEMSSLAVPSRKRSLYTAHEVLQILPMLDHQQTYQRFLLANSCSRSYLANAYHQLYSDLAPLVSSSQILSQLVSLICYFPNLASYLLQRLYMYPKLTSEYISLTSAYFHPHDPASDINTHLSQKRI